MRRNYISKGQTVVMLLLFICGSGLFVFLYLLLVDNPIDTETMQRIQETQRKGLPTHTKLQNLFIQERGWFLISLGILAISVIAYTAIAKTHDLRSSFLGYHYRLSAKLSARSELDFQTKLLKRFPHLSPNDLLFAEMLVDGLTTKEISAELNIAPASANTARYRLRKKMGLPAGENLILALQGY